MKKDCIIFGAGEEGKQALKLLGKERVQYFADNNLDLQGKKIDKIEIISYEKLKKVCSKYHIIIATQKYFLEIEKQLGEDGILDADDPYQFLIKEKFNLAGNNANRIILMSTQDGINIGDHLISIAELYFFKRYLPEYTVVEMPAMFVNRGIETIKKFISQNDILVISGGGFLGSLWLSGEENVRKVIDTFPDNRIIIFPQTLFFENTKEGKRQKKLTQEIYEKHQNLTICLRDKNSYELAEKMFKDYLKILYMPDMVMLLDRSDEIDERKRIGLCLREDKEGILGVDLQNKIKEIVNNKKEGYVEFSMLASENIMTAERMDRINQRVSIVQKCRLVITDRLHCMLLCAITGTPCIAFDNLSGKVRGVYSWISNNEYIKFAENFEQMEAYIEMLWDKKGCIYKNEENKKLFYKLAEEIRKG